MPYVINFADWYIEKKPVFFQKMKFMFNYFEMFKLEEEYALSNEGKYRIVSFERLSLSMAEYETLTDEFWTTNQTPLQHVEIMETELIEDVENTIMIDFANRFLGGGVMSKG